MNIQDVRSDALMAPKRYGALLPQILKDQEELMQKYKEIEKLPDWPLFFDGKDEQDLMKSLLWRVTEEISEGVEALYEIELAEDSDVGLVHQHVTHFFEEMSDAIHFLVELMIISAVPIKPQEHSNDVLVQTYDFQGSREPDCTFLGDAFLCKPGAFFHSDGDIRRRFESKIVTRILDLEIYRLIDHAGYIQYLLGLCGNVLKNKRWKQTDVPSDKNAFNQNVQNVCRWLFRMLFRTGLNPTDVYLLYAKKKEVNKWRQQTKY